MKWRKNPKKFAYIIFLLYLCTEFDGKEVFMTAIQLNADIYQHLLMISENESMLKRVAKYLKRLTAELAKDPTCMTKEEYFARLDAAEREIAEGKGTTFTNKADMNAWLNAL